MGTLPAGLANASTIPGHPGNYKVGATGAISSPYCLYDASGNSGGSALWTPFLAADQAIQFDQVVNLSGAVINPLIRMSASGQTGYGAFISWSTPKIDFVAINTNGEISPLSSPAIPLYQSGVQVTIKLEIQGTNLRFKCWPTGTTEPTSWTATTTDSTFTAAGYGGFSSDGGAVDNVYVGPAETTFSGGFLAPVLSSGSITWNSAQLEWTAASQSGGTITYQVMRSMHGANDFIEISSAASSPFTDSMVEPSSRYDYVVKASDGINAPVDSNGLTLATPAAPASTAFTLTGPSWGGAGKVSEAFEVSPNGSYTGQIKIVPSGCGLSTPIVLTFASSSKPQTFSLTPITTGTITLTATNTGGLQDPEALHYASTVIAPFVMGSGQTIGMTAPGSITALNNGNAVQTLTLKGIVSGSGSTFPLSFNGQTTAGIAESVTYPTTYGKFTIPTVEGTTYEVAYNLYVGGGADADNCLVQVFDGNILVASVVVNQYVTSPDAVIPNGDGQGHTLYMKNITTVTSSTSTLTVWVTTDDNTGPDTNVVVDCVSLKNVATGTITYYDDSNSAVFTNGGLYVVGSGAGAYDGGFSVSSGMTVGGVQFAGSASAIQSALQALSNIGTGNVTVTGSNPFTITFTGSLGLATQPLITSTDPAVTITQAQAGGALPTYTVTHQGGSPGSPIPLSTFVWGQTSQVAPYVFMPLPQSFPDHVAYPNHQGYCATGGSWSFAPSLGLSGWAQYSTTSGSYAQSFAQGIPPATYQIALTWVPDGSMSTSASLTVVDTVSQATLLSTTVNQSVALGSGSGDFTYNGVTWRIAGSVTTTNPSVGLTLTLENTGGTIGFDSFLVSRTSSNLSQTILETDTVSVNFPAGFVTTAEGASPAFSGVIPNFAGGQTSFQPGGFGVVPSGPVTMEVGYNVTADSYFNTCLILSDQVSRIGSPMNGAVTSDANGYPTLLSSQQPQFNEIVESTILQDEYGMGRGQASAPYGYWTVQWDDTQSSGDLLNLSNYAASITEVMEYQDYSGTTKQRVFNVQPAAYGPLAPVIGLETIPAASADSNGHYPFSINNFHIYPPDPSDPTGMTPWGIKGTSTPPRFWPNYVAKFAGAKCIRFMNWNGANGGQPGELSDFAQVGQLAGINTRNVTATVTSIANYTAPALFDPTQSLVLQFVTSAASQVFNLVAGTVTFTGTIELSNSQTITGSVSGILSPVSATVFQMQVTSSTGGVTMTNTLTGSFTLDFGCQTAQPLEDCFTLCNEVGADCWLSISPTMTDSGMAAVAAAAASGLNRGLKLYAEFGNECWNDYLASYRLCNALTYQITGSESNPQVGQMVRGAAWHNACLTAFTAVGRASDVVRVVGSQASYTGPTIAIIAAAQAHSIDFDAVATAPYFDPFNDLGQENQFQNTYDLMTPYGSSGNLNDGSGGQATDWMELMAVFGNQPQIAVVNHKTLLNSAGLTSVNMLAYEGGPTVLTPNASTVNSAYRSHCVLWHPRAFWWMAAFLQSFQNAGMTLFMRYYISGANQSNGTVPNVSYSEWSTFGADNQRIGTGTLADTVNANNPEQVDQLLSELGGGISYWNSLVMGGVIGTTSEVTITHSRAKGQGPHGTQGRTTGG